MNGVIDWQVQQECLSERALYILKNSLWTDCKFIVGTDDLKREFNAHKLVLSMASPVFEMMFKNCFNEAADDVIIVDIQPDVFETMLNYIYGDKISIHSFDQACELGYVANKYMMPHLLKQCTGYIEEAVDATNACRGYEFAKLFDQHDLMDKCKRIICEKTSTVIGHSNFVEAQLSTLMMILDVKRLRIDSENELFNATMKWTKREFERRGIVGAEFSQEQQSIYDQLAPKICFLTMKPKEFAEGPALSPLLTKDQSFAVFMNISSSNCNCPLPEGFTTRIRQMKDSAVILNLDLQNTCYRDDYDRGWSNNRSESSLEFNCTKDITLFGITVMSEVEMNRLKDDCLTVEIRDSGSQLYEFKKSLFRRNDSSIIEAHFPTPVKLFQGRKYYLRAVSNVPRLEGGEMTRPIFKHKRLQFQLFSCSSPTFIHGFIYKPYI